ncbi:MAG: hypothetical protein FJZ00_12590, partial [Candidatus Sericytochromatia bacterium]|nr:hypothetical protein [Candidatus Tanganyikabacteria bacterium]
GADGIIVGSALVQRLHEWRDAPDLARRAGAFVAELADRPIHDSVGAPEAQ